MEKATIEVFCKIAKKISQVRSYTDYQSKEILNDALELMAIHCDCSVDMLFRNMIDEIFENIHEQKKIK